MTLFSCFWALSSVQILVRGNGLLLCASLPVVASLNPWKDSRNRIYNGLELNQSRIKNPQIELSFPVPTWFFIIESEVKQKQSVDLRLKQKILPSLTGFARLLLFMNSLCRDLFKLRNSNKFNEEELKFRSNLAKCVEFLNQKQISKRWKLLKIF